jgi:hypothetical protein
VGGGGGGGILLLKTSVLRSDDSPEWNYVSEADRQRMHLTFEEDGEFWMSLEDFHDNFQVLGLRYLSAGFTKKEGKGLYVLEP